MPSKCHGCPYDDFDFRCKLTGFDHEDYVMRGTRDVRCPLKPMPEKKEVEVNKIEDIMRAEYSIEDIYTNKYIATIRLATDKLISLGWNACLEELEND